jgi:hypothetical protein
LFTFLFLVVGIKLQAQSTATVNSSATIISANAIDITEQTDTSFAYSTITNSSAGSTGGFNIPDKGLTHTFCMANININSGNISAVSFTIPPTITLNHTTTADEIKLETFIKTSWASVLATQIENIQIDCNINFPVSITTGLYNSGPFAVTINYN